MKRYTEICAASEGITYSFENGQTITFQDNFKYLGDVAFTVYFDFETTTDGAIFVRPKNIICELLSSLLVSSVPKAR